MKKLTKGIIPNLTTLVFTISLWVLISNRSDNIIPPPSKTFIHILKFLKSPPFYQHLLYTLVNIIVGLSLSILTAIVLVVLFKLLPTFFQKVISPVISTILFIPAVIAIYIFIIIFGYNFRTTILVIMFIVTPSLIIMFSSIIKQLNSDYLKISFIYRIGKLLTIKKIVLPQIIPILLASLINGFSLTTKIAILAEATIGNKGIGYLIAYNFYLFNLANVLALTILFIAITFYLPKIVRKIYLSIRRPKNKLWK